MVSCSTLEWEPSTVPLAWMPSCVKGSSRSEGALTFKVEQQFSILLLRIIAIGYGVSVCINNPSTKNVAIYVLKKKHLINDILSIHL